MKNKLVPVLAAALMLAAVPFTAQEGGALSAERVVACTSIEDREPVGASDTFPADVGVVWCFTQIKGAQGETAVTHVWYRGDKEVNRAELPVRAASWRTWSKKTIPADWAGSWRVAVLDASGNEIGSVSFTVGQ